jgi:hypothetical protein
MKRFAFSALICSAALALSAQSAPQSVPQTRPAQGQALEAPKEASLSGVLAFSGEDPAVKTDAETVLLDMPKFYYYAYADGLKAGMAVKVKGRLMKTPSGDSGSQPRLAVSEMTINGKTYVVPAGPDSRAPGRGAPGAPGAPGPDGMGGR